MTHPFLSITLAGAPMAGKTLVARALDKILRRLGRRVFWHNVDESGLAPPRRSGLIIEDYDASVTETQAHSTEDELRCQIAQLKATNRRLRTLLKIMKDSQ